MSTREAVKFLILCSSLWLIVPATPVSGQKLTQLTVGYSAISINQLPGWVAKETGIFARNGLEVQLVYFTGGTPALMALVSGYTAISQNSGPETVNAHLGGSDVVFIAGGTVTLDWWLLSRSEIKTAEQLKGGTVAISRFGSASDFVARFALQRMGLVPEKDVTIIQLGSTTDRLAALGAARIQATVLPPPTMLMALKSGLNLLADVSTLGLAFQHTAPVTTRRFIRENPDIVKRYLKSHVEAVHRIKTDRETGIRVMTKYLGQSKDKESTEKSYDRYVTEEQLPRKQYPTLEGIRTVLNALADKDPKAKTVKAEDLVDMRFIRELDQSGFIQSLYAR